MTNLLGKYFFDFATFSGFLGLLSYTEHLRTSFKLYELQDEWEPVFLNRGPAVPTNKSL